MYADVLEFHRRAYKFIRRRCRSTVSHVQPQPDPNTNLTVAWTFFFGSLWDNFDSRFKSILAELAYHGDLVDKEASAIDVVTSSKHQKEDAERFEKQEKEWKNVKLSATLSWLGLSSHVVDSKLDSLTRDCSPGACDWLLEHPKIKQWLQDQDPCSVVWLHGKPGAGETKMTANGFVTDSSRQKRPRRQPYPASGRDCFGCNFSLL